MAIKENTNIQEKKFYPNIAYNKTQRTKFFTMTILLVLCMGMVVGLMVAIDQIMFAILFGSLLIMVFTLIPSALKNNPIKPDVAQIVVKGKEVTVHGKTRPTKDIEKVVVTITLSPVSKIASENKEFLLETAKTYPEEPFLGTVDVYYKKSLHLKKSEEVAYTTVDDCIGALNAMVSAGVKHYKILFSLKKFTEPATFSLKKEESEKPRLTDVSQKDRLKQLM